MTRSFLFAIVALIMSVSATRAGDGADSAYAPMAVFAELAGRSWRGEGTGPNGQPIVDIARYELILGGRALQSTHRLEGETYGGRTIYFYDEAADAYIFHYFTTAGFHTVGAIEPTQSGFKSVETIEGLPEIAEVHAQISIDGDRMRVESFHLNHEGDRSTGDTIVYAEIDDPGALYESVSE